MSRFEGRDARTLEVDPDQLPGHISLRMTFTIGGGFAHHAPETLSTPWVHLPLAEAGRLADALSGSDSAPNVA